MSLSLQLSTAYQDLLQRHLARPSLAIDGAIIERKKAGNTYWVARKRAGDRVVETSIGPDKPEIRAIVEEAKHQQIQHQSWSRETAASVAMLRAAKCLTPDLQIGRVLSALSEAGFFHAGGILGGTQAFRHYPLILGVAPPQISVLQTGDVDLLTPSALRLIGKEGSLSARISALGINIEPVFGMTADAPAKWRLDDGIELDLLSPVARGGAISRDHPGVGQRVQALKFLEFSMETPLPAVSLYRSGILINVPPPERFALHKLIVAQLRTGAFREKRVKDLAQAAWLIEKMSETHGYELWAAWGNLRHRGKKWRDHADASLAMCHGARDILRGLEADFGAIDLSYPTR